EFKAVQNEITALEIELTATKAVEPKISIFVPTDPIDVVLTGFEIRNFTRFSDRNEEQTQLEIGSVSLKANESVKIRAYFKGLNKTTSSITSQVVTEDNLLKETFYFPIFTEKPLNVTITPSSAIVGENILVSAKDEEGLGIETVKIIIKTPTGRTVKELLGNGQNNRGLNGRYLIENNLDPGNYKIQILAEGFKFFETELEIGKKNVLKIETPITLNIQKDTGKTSKVIEVENTSDDAIEGIGFEIVSTPTSNAEIKLEVSGISRIEGKQKQNITLRAEYKGENKELRTDGDYKLIVHGNIVGKYATRTESSVYANYNQKLEADCIEFSKSRLSVSLLAETDFSGPSTRELSYANPLLNPAVNLERRNFLNTSGLGSEKQVELTAKNKCNETVTLTPEIPANSFIEVKSNPITIQAGQEQPIIITVGNKVNVLNFGKKIYNIELRFKADQLVKRLPLDVMVWSSKFALVAPTNIELSIAERKTGEKTVIGEPIQIMNAGEADIEAIELSTDPSNKGGLKFDILPHEPYPVLKRGQQIFPPKFLQITADQLKSGDVLSQIFINGTIEGKRVLLRQINLVIHVSAANCLEIAQSRYDFVKDQVTGVIGKELTITNHCSEPVRITSVTATNDLGLNTLSRTPLSNAKGEIPREGIGKFSIEFGVNQEQKTETGLVINGVLLNSQTPIESEPIPVNIDIGPGARVEGAATLEYDIPICEEKEKTLKIKFPLQANELNANCSNSYCDSTQIAEFLVKKISDKVEQVKNRIGLEKGLQTQSFKTFEDLGVKDEIFTVFLQNDVLTPDVLKNEIEKEKLGYSRLKTFSTEYDTVQGFESKRPATNFLSNRIFQQTDSMKGCGSYSIRIKGSVPVINNKLREDSAMVFIEQTQKNSPEPLECAPRIENFSNFLPTDKGIDTATILGTLPGTVFTDNSSLDDLGQRLAKVLFGTEKRFVQHNTNKLLLDFGPVMEKKLLKLQMGSSLGNVQTI
ncbi:MAG: hypothetical protein Q7K42_03605, partial [Candidatus Diapherotrites archaeon]|nr:hypothetical protein [Candidatus Diapherotrites archaeon]